MSVLNKPYELSVWEDIKSGDTLVEQKLCIIGAHDMVSQSRALQPKLVQNINGTNTFSFSMYYRYKDNITGEEVENPFTQYLTNERKLKLKYDDRWYDLIIKSVKIDSTKYSYDVTANDQYITELSKNGFNLTFDAQLNNNLGTIQYLASEALKETDWTVVGVGNTSNNRYSEYINDIEKEALVILQVKTQFTAYPFTENETTGQIVWDTTSGISFTVGTQILGFYSCCKSKNPYFQFIYSSNPYEKDDERVIVTKGCHYQIKVDEYDATNMGISIPPFCTLPISGDFISNEYRGARYVYSPIVSFNTTLQKYVTEYTRSSDTGYGFSETEYIAPNFIQNYATNPNGFKSTAGWTTGITVNNSYRATIKNEAARADDPTITLIDDLKSGEFGEQTYIPYLRLEEAEGQTATNNIIVNSGFYDSRINIENLEIGQTYVFKYRTNDDENIRIRVGSYGFDAESHKYTLTDDSTYLDTDEAIVTWHKTEEDEDEDDSNDLTWTYKAVIVKNSQFTPNDYKKQRTNKVYLVISGFTVGTFRIYDLQCYKGLKRNPADENNPYVSPEDQLTSASIVDNYYIYDKSALDGATVVQTRDDFNPIWHNTIDPILDGWGATYSVEKRRGLTIKESNYYNIISTLCENFECWAEYYVDHDAYGNVQGKYLYFHNYTGDFNYAGFRYGVNLKSVQRTDDSKQIVSKLIVRQNSNEFGQNGFCTIARAPSNETGDTTLYNVDYYINQGLLSAADWNEICYDTRNAAGADVDDEFDPSTDTTNCNGYYVRLYNLNTAINEKNEALKNKAVALAAAEANKQLYENGLLSAQEQLAEAADSFKAMFGEEYYEFQTTNESGDHYINPAYLESVQPDNIKYLIACAELYTAVQEYTVKAAAATSQYTVLKSDYNTLDEQAQALRNQKVELNKAFYSLCYRYIQEGTWLSENYYDDELYYIDAQSTLYNSSVPKVTYSISVLELSQLLGYEGFDFSIGDRSYIEDPEFFGYDENGYPIREAITLTEITYNLDQPEKNNIKVQNYKSQFQDLFKKITATVQSVQYSTGAYDKAAQLADADSAMKSEYLESGLNDASTILQNSGDQTVRLDSEGLTITDGIEKNRILRAVGGGILLSNDGGNTWELSIASDGINAKTITSGTLNTGVINIMYGSEPTFRWDGFGITAYDFDDPLKPIVTRGVRFDRWGVYGFDLGDEQSDVSADWKPTAISGWTIINGALQPAADTTQIKYLRNRSIFELTKEGLYLNLGRGKTLYDYIYTLDEGAKLRPSPKYHESNSQLGKIEDLIYNSWSNDIPYYDSTKETDIGLDFVKIMSIGNSSTGSEKLAIYDDGTIVAQNIHLRGSLIYSTGAGLISSVYTQVYQNTPTGSWNSYPNTSTTSWHKTQSANDIWYATTYDNSASWVGPIRLSSKEVASSILYYAADASDSATTDELTWYTDVSDVDTPANKGKYLYTGTLPTYYDGSEPSYPEIISITLITGDGKNGTSVRVQEIYYSATSYSTPTKPGTTANDWVTSESTLAGAWGIIDRDAVGPTISSPLTTKTYVYKATQTRTTVYDEDNTVLTDTCSCTDPVLYKAYNDENNIVNQKTYAEYIILTQNKASQGLYYGTGGDLYINASCIKTGSLDANLITTGALLVKDSSNNTIFSANITNNTVTIGGFTVTQNSIYKNKSSISATSDGVYIGTDGIALGYDSSGGTLFSVTNEGALTARSGTIGGWTITNTQLKIGTLGSANGIGLIPAGTSVGGTSNVVFTAGANFKVTKTGQLYSSDGKIGGWTIGATGLTYGSINTSGGIGLVPAGNTVGTIHNVVLYAGQNFKVTTDGSLYATSGTIADWTISSTALYAGTTSSLVRAINWGNISSPDLSLYIGKDGVSYCLDKNSAYYTTAIRGGGASFYGNPNGSTYQGIEIIPDEICFYQFGATNPRNASSSTTFNTTGKITVRTNDVYLSGSWTLNGVKSITYTGTDSTNYSIVINNTVVSFKSGSTVVGTFHTYASYVDITGTWKTNGNNWISSSDRRVKKDFTAFDERYNALFDALQPQTYKYIDGNQGRVHSGFVAQEVIAALEQANISINENAYVCAFNLDDPDPQYGLRYEEFIPLNTWQIQQLKSRIAHLEARIQELEKS